MAAALCRKMLSNNLRQKFADYSAAKVVRFVDIYRYVEEHVRKNMTLLLQSQGL